MVSSNFGAGHGVVATVVDWGLISVDEDGLLTEQKGTQMHKESTDKQKKSISARETSASQSHRN
jgi:hypothetical protein